MKTKISIAVAFLMVLAIGGCNFSRQNKKSTNKKEVIKIGAILPLTGDLANYGVQERNGMLLKAEEFNNDSIKIKIFFEDSKSKVVTAINALQKLLLTDNPLLIFTLGSSITNGLIPLINSNKIPLISVAADQSIANRGDYIFRNFPSAELQTKVLAKTIIDNFGISNLSILFINDDFGIASRNGLVKSFNELGGKIDNEYPFKKSAKNYRDIIQKIISAKPPAIYIGGYGESLGFILKQLKEYHYQGAIFTSLEVAYPEVLHIAGKAANNVIFADIPYSSNSNNLQIKNFVKKYFSEYNKTPTLDAVLAYDQTSIICSILSHNPYINREELKRQLLKVHNFEGVAGNISILPNGDFNYSVVIKTIKNGSVKIKSFQK